MTGAIRVCLFLFFATLLAALPDARAQGYGVYEQSACMMGRGGAGVASPCPDASAIYFNPAGIVTEPGAIGSVGASIIAPRGHFTDTATDRVSSLNNRYHPVPDVYFKSSFAGGRVAAGFGLFVPYGLTTDWPIASQGRFLGYKSLVHAFYLQPTVAFRLNDRVAVGGGIDVTRTNVELRQHLDLAAQTLSGPLTFGAIGVPPGTDFADVRLVGDAWHAGYHLGVLVTPSSTFSVGARYLSGQRVDVTNGTVSYTQIPTGLALRAALGPGLPAGTPIDAILKGKFSGAGPLISQGATTTIVLPDQLVIGAAVHVTPKLTALADYQFVRWSMFDALVITQAVAGTQSTIEDYGNTSGVRLGVDYALNAETAIRAGADFHGAAAPAQTVTPNLPEGSRAEFSVGVGRKFGPARLDAYYLYLHQGDRAGRTVGPPSGQAPTTALNNGTYAFMANLFGVTVAFGF